MTDTKTLKFEAHLADMILNGTKTATWRFFDDKNLKTGDEVVFIKRPDFTPFAKAVITSVITKPLGQITELDKNGHEDVGTYTEMCTRYSGYYKTPIDATSEVKIIRFKVVSTPA
jgi:hypothetical protein